MSPVEGPELRLMTAVHEAAHAAVAVAVGQKVFHASIKPKPASAYFPGSLGRVCLWPHPVPRPEDGWPNSHWTETFLLVHLAGYTVEDLAWPETAGIWGAVPDYLAVIDMLRIFHPRDPAAVAGAIVTARRKCHALLRLPQVNEPLFRIAEALLVTEEIKGDALYRNFYGKLCSALHPTDPSLSCQKTPHPAGTHWIWPNDTDPVGMKWDGLSLPDPRMRVGQLTPNLKAMRALNEGGRPRPLNDKWRTVLEAFDSPLESLDHMPIS